jgi:NAD(P)-dependent dehydrogenase (short-subunit alcohol dehydrogenase family)
VNPTDILLTDQVAVITGGANGLGEGVAMSMARFGAHIAIVDIDAERGERVAAAVRALGRQALFVAADATDSTQLVAAIERVHQQFGRIDILMNNVGGVRRVAFVDQSERSWRKHIDLNFVSMLSATQAAAKLMIAGKRGGTILNVASSEALRAAPGFAVYAACKAAMVSFSRSMALELADHGIRVHALAPDMIETPGLKPYFDAANPAEIAARDRYIPLGRLGTTEEFGAVAVFLCSKMSSYLTGLTIPVDAGALASSGWTRSPTDGKWNLYHG